MLVLSRRPKEVFKASARSCPTERSRLVPELQTASIPGSQLTCDIIEMEQHLGSAYAQISL